jgi:chromosome segregation ATPase
MAVSEAQTRVAWEERSAGTREHSDRLQKEIGALLPQIAELQSASDSAQRQQPRAESEKVEVQADLDGLRQESSNRWLPLKIESRTRWHAT